jgi:integrase
MARPPKPWYWKERGAWYVTIRGKRVRLHEDKKKAIDKFHKTMATPTTEVSTEMVVGIFGVFLEWLAANRAPKTYEWYQKRLTYFLVDNPSFTCDVLKPFHVQAWLDKKKWASGHKRGVVTALKGAFNWAVKMELLTRNPILGLSKPAAGRREEFLTKTEFETVLAKVKDQEFRDVLRFMWFTGARPQELVKIEARHVRAGHVVFAREESKGKLRERVVFLVPEAQEIADRLAEKVKVGPIFRNRRGKPWTANNFACRFQRLEEKIGTQHCMYKIRHGYAHYALTEAKLPPEVVASLMGHQDTRQLMQTYGHMLQNAEFMNEAARKASGSASTPDPKLDLPESDDPEEQIYGGA